MNIFVEKASYIISPFEKQLVIYKNRDLSIENSYITCIDTNCVKPRDAYVINGYNRIVLPGFINTNIDIVAHYIQSYLTNSFSQNIFNNIMKIWNEVVDEELAKYMSRVICLKLLLSGFIGFIPTTGYPHIMISECKEYNQYMGLGPVMGFKETISLNSFKSICNEYRKCIPVYTFYNSIDLINESNIEESYRVASLGFKKKIELSRFKREVFLFKKNTGKWPIEYLYSRNLIDQNTLLTHLNWITSMELGFLKTSSSYTSISPSTTLFIGERGFPPIYEFIIRDIPVTIGFSGLINSDLSIFNELKTLYFMYRFLYGDGRADLLKILYHIIYYSHLFLGIDSNIVNKNSIANIIILKNNVDYSIDPVLNLILSNPQVEYVIINGYIYLSPLNRIYYEEQLNYYLKIIIDTLVSKISLNT